MKIILATVGSLGDVIPCFPMANAFRSQGHEVQIWSTDSTRQTVEARGFAFEEIHQTLEKHKRRSNHPDFGHPSKGIHLVTDMFINISERVLSLIKEHYEPGNTVVIAPSRIFGARIAQELLGVPLISYQLAPHYLSTWDTYDNDAVERELGPKLDGFRADLGLPKRTQPICEWQFSPDAVWGLFPEWFAPLEHNWPKQVELFDFPLVPPFPLAIADEIQTFLDGGSKPVIFTPGTYTQNTAQFFDSAVEVCEELRLRAILAPATQEMAETLPPSFLCMSWCSFQHMLPYASCMVHAGGVGALSEAVRAGVPQIVLPAVFDQFDNADRMEAAGLGFHLREGFQKDQMKAALQNIHSERIQSNCRSISQKYDESRLYGQLLQKIDQLTGTTILS